MGAMSEQTEGQEKLREPKLRPPTVQPLPFWTEEDWAQSMGMSVGKFLELVEYIREAKRIIDQHGVEGELFLCGVTFNRSPSPRLREVVEDAAKSMKALMRMLEATDDPKDEFTIVYERLQEAESALAAIEEEMK